MSKTRHDCPEPLVRTYAVTHPPGFQLDSKQYEHWDLLLFASGGAMDVESEAGLWVIPSHRAVWIPANTAHRIGMNGRVTMRSLFFRRSFTIRRMPRVCQVLNITALLRELILHATNCVALRNEVPRDARFARVIVDQMVLLSVMPLQLPMPKDPRALVVAERLRRVFGDTSIDDAAKQSGVTRRTLERIFARETNMTLGRWWQRARIIESLRLLARGATIEQVAYTVGYNSPSAFIVAFRNTLGTTPKQYFKRGAKFKYEV